MSRNKYPEETIERILEVSKRLFLEKGYENTSIQDILNELGNLSKGAIYHHFKSKEDIFNAVIFKMGEPNHHFFAQTIENTKLNGAEKLKEFLKLNVLSIATQKIIGISPNLLDNPKFLSIQIKQTIEVVAPNFIYPIILEGVEDGSIKTDNAFELAEIITLLINVWLNPLILGANKQRLPEKCKFTNELVAQYNITLFDDKTIAKLSEL